MKVLCVFYCFIAIFSGALYAQEFLETKLRLKFLDSLTISVLILPLYPIIFPIILMHILVHSFKEVNK